MDLITGSGRFNIKYRDKLVYESIHTTQIGVPIQLGQNMFNQGALTDMISHGGNTVVNAAALNPVGMLANGLSAIGDAAALSQPISSSLGSNGTLSFNNVFGLMADFLDIADEDLSSRGRPLCAPRQISGLSGYILCEDADPQISCTAQELETIVNYMNSGFYYE